MQPPEFPQGRSRDKVDARIPGQTTLESTSVNENVNGNAELNRMDEDYLATWPMPAQKLLRAARRLLVNKGYDALRWEAIAREAGVQKSLIRYYFRDTTGLLRALLRLVSQDATLWMVDRVQRLPQGPARIKALVSGTRELTRNRQFLSFLDVLPHAFRNDSLRAPLAELYSWARDVHVRNFGVERTEDNARDLEAIASLCMAAADGIAIQATLDPDRYDPEPAFAKLERVLQVLLDEANAAREPVPPSGTEESPGDDRTQNPAPS